MPDKQEQQQIVEISLFVVCKHVHETAARLCRMAFRRQRAGVVRRRLRPRFESSSCAAWNVKPIANYGKDLKVFLWKRINYFSKNYTFIDTKVTKKTFAIVIDAFDFTGGSAARVVSDFTIPFLNRLW